ncbi:MAG: lytic transglycosylase domain-containing protein [Candidatus Eremiobacteraeota bacterium]|nr:lytic transglycosylase domain-containing protein [Candidatus Eremiobacteraeota bacterium]
MIEKTGSQYITGKIYQNRYLTKTGHDRISSQEDQLTLNDHFSREMPGVIRPFNIKKSEQVKPKSGKVKKLVSGLMLGLTFLGSIASVSSHALMSETRMEPTQVEEVVETKESQSKDFDYKLDLNSENSAAGSEKHKSTENSDKTGLGLKKDRDVTSNSGNIKIPDFGSNPSKMQISLMLEAASEKYGVPPDILKAVAWQESSWRPNVESFDGGHGKGIMQIDNRYHKFANTADVWNPTKNIEYGTKYLSDIQERTGNWQRSLERYNGGSSYPQKVFNHVRNKPWRKYVPEIASPTDKVDGAKDSPG